MRTDQLIRSLVTDLATPSGSVGKTIAIILPVSLAISLLGIYFGLGLRPDFKTAITTAPFWLKAGYTILIGVAGLFALERLGRLGTTATRYFVFIGVLIAALAFSAVTQITLLPDANRGRAWLGGSWSLCPWLVLASSVPILFAAFAILRQMAPTNYGAASGAAGLMAGGFGASIYSLHCTEHTLAFLSTWYTLGVVLVVALSLVEKHLLRW